MAKGFGTEFFKEMTVAKFENNAWGETEFCSSDSLNLHPASHVLHYSSTCFEGLKAFRTEKGECVVFRLDDHIKRMQRSAKGLLLPTPDAKQLKAMILDLLNKYKSEIPKFPSTAYIRPTLIGTDPAIGKAADPSQTALLYILISPVGGYLQGIDVKLLIDEKNQRCAPHFGSVKAGGNYASALSIVYGAKEEYGVQQVLFCPNGDVQETAATNCLLINDKQIITKGVCDEFLPGITRDSVLKAAKKLGYEIIERDITVKELLDWVKDGELMLSGTAATVVPVKELIYNDKTYLVNQGNECKNANKIKTYIEDLRLQKIADDFNWLTII